MHPDWQFFLQEQGAVVEDGGSVNFSHDANESDNIIAAISHLCLIQVSGNDAAQFLNGQFTTNITKLKEKESQFSAWCNPKGQVKTTFFIYKSESIFYLLLPAELKETFLKQLQMYIMRSDVTLTDISDEFPLIGLQSGSAYSTDDEVHSIKMFASDKKSYRYLLFGPAVKLIEAWKELTSDHQSCSFQNWKRLDILSGYPWLSPETSEQFLPQMLNLNLMNALDYQKGCYPGQEIIARLHYRGELKRSLFLASCTSEVELHNADKIFTPDKESNVGTVINTINYQNQYEFLAVIDKEHIEAQLSIHDADTNTIQVHTLPYQDSINTE